MTYLKFKRSFISSIRIEYACASSDVLDMYGEMEIKMRWRNSIINTQNDRFTLMSYFKTFGGENYLSTFRGAREQEFRISLSKHLN